ncbi:SusE domain-containing protein [Hymenobacter sp. PAMC 26628]|uniref:SusE domain-containing protein n=1 Tax=Hymenobacter sp. PAMC 26628 TaxID=1484118 RepID=UPI00077051EF|nr:SusE domain-containing protein [Hymenobacter sp. PAMC 26628]AMJ65760.1 hypothetical protein AXW84_10215 [Hymenobacter sp. PAMC 26628]
MASCKKDETQATIAPANAATLTASTANVVLKSVNGTQTAVTYTWSPITFTWGGTESTAYSPALTYSLQFDKKGNNFASPVSVDAGSGPTKTFTVASLNSSLISLGLAPEAATDVEVRLKATYASNVAPLYSPTLALNATPYSTELYISSSLSNDLAMAPKLLEIDGKPRQYQGYVYFGGTSASTFKVTNTRAANGTVYGNTGTAAIAAQPAGTAATGSLASPGSSFSVAPGFYLVQINLSNMTWSATPTTWAVIGAATPKGWDGDTPMTYDAAKKVWTVTTTLTNDQFKFRANGAWSVNLGNAKPVNGYLAPDGDNLQSPGAGKYTIMLDLNDITKPKYSVQ